ncbi:MAG: DUF302 domain-containing protein [Gammaproteobacteria bacterium]|nr:DUF302 domain-containing protein [Gammaproteobacteria bacterium]
MPVPQMSPYRTYGVKAGSWLGLIVGSLMLSACANHSHRIISSSIPSPVAGTPPISTNSPLYVIPVKRGVTPAQIKMAIETGAEGENMNVVGTLDVQQGLQARGIKSNSPYVIYEVCNLVLGAKILKSTPQFGAFAPCKIVMYEQNGKMNLLTYLPTYALRYFPKNAESQKVALHLDKMIIHVMKQAANGGL